MMIPFMGIQSAVMAEQFGTMFQYGKRRISAMSNEEFNALTPQKLQERMTTQLEGMIPEMKEQIKAMQPMVTAILHEFGEYVRLAVAEIPGALAGTAGPIGSAALDAGAHLLGTHVGHDVQTETVSKFPVLQQKSTSFISTIGSAIEKKVLLDIGTDQTKWNQMVRERTILVSSATKNLKNAYGTNIPSAQATLDVHYKWLKLLIAYGQALGWYFS